MKRLIGYIGTLGALVLGFYIYSAPLAFADTTTTITGYAVPNAAGLNNGIFTLLLPVVICGLFLGLSSGLGVEGEINSFVIKIGLLAGAVVGMLSLTSTPPTIIPFAVVVVASVYFITYLWKRV